MSEKTLMCCGREATQSDGHIFEGHDYIEWWCETCGQIVQRVNVEPSEYIPVIFV
jgi:hypothetical protein